MVWEDSFKMDHKGIGSECGLNSSGSGQELVVDSHEGSKKSLCSIKGR